MNRIVILSLSDIHLDVDRQDVQESIFNDFLKEFRNFVKTEGNMGWKPHYLVVAGDVINKGKVRNYALAKKLIEKICLEFKIPHSHVIMTPGNHDKAANTIADDAEYEKAKKNFAKFCALPRKPERKPEEEKNEKDRKNEKVLADFLEIHKKGFDHFCRFYDEISLSKNTYPFVTYPLLEGTGIEGVSGIKIFEEDKICFLTLNTEWLYAADDRLKTTPKKEIVYEVGKNIIAYLYGEIRKRCPNFTVVTLMHRSPYEMSWFDINETDHITKRAFGYIEKCSDVIITGHDHSVSKQVPDFIRNRVQHFRLGSSGWQHPSDGITFPYIVSALRIDTVNECVELLRGRYEQPSEWTFTILKEQFPLRNKSDRYYYSIAPAKRRNENPETLLVDNYNKKELEIKIKAYYLYPQNANNQTPIMKVCEIAGFDYKIPNFIDDIVSNDTENTYHLVFYYKKLYVDYDQKLIEHAITTFEETVNKYQTHVFLGKLIFNFLSVEMPLKWIENKNYYGI